MIDNNYIKVKCSVTMCGRVVKYEVMLLMSCTLFVQPAQDERDETSVAFSVSCFVRLTVVAKRGQGSHAGGKDSRNVIS